MIRSTFSSWREYLTPITHTSTFRETGEITPEEFVEAGDYLVYKFPTWQWSPAPLNKRKEFLPDDKQVLVTRHVPSYVRAESYLGADQVEDKADEVTVADDIDEEGWTATSVLPHHGATNKSVELPLEADDQSSVKEVSSEEEYDDIDDLIDETAEDEDEDAEDSKIAGDPNKRNYDLYISYSTSYRVPKMYLVGFNSNGSPLSPSEMFEDIVPDYRHKTATIEKAPFLSRTTAVSIHPCKHASVMKVLMSRAAIAQRRKLKLKEQDITKGVAKLGLKDSGNQQEEEIEDAWESIPLENEAPIIRVDQYLIIFLKFISSVTPGIEHDYTMDAF